MKLYSKGSQKLEKRMSIENIVKTISILKYNMANYKELKKKFNKKNVIYIDDSEGELNQDEQ